MVVIRGFSGQVRLATRRNEAMYLVLCRDREWALASRDPRALQDTDKRLISRIIP